MRRSVLVARLALAALAAAAAAGAAEKDTNLALVAYSIPTAVFPKLEAAYRRRRRATGVKFSNSFAASEVQSKAVAAGLPADVVNFSISTDMDRLVGAKLVDKTWANEQVPRHRLEVGRRLRAAERQPEAHQDVGRPREAGRRRRLPEPVQLRRRALGRHGRVRRACCARARRRSRRVAYLTQLFKHNVSQDTSGRNALNTFLVGPGRRAARLRERREARAVAGQARLLPDPEGDAADRDAARRRQQPATRPRRTKFVNWLYTPAAQTIWAQNGFRPVDLNVLAQVQEAVPAAAAALQDRLRRRLGQGEHAVLRSDERDRREDRAGARSLHWRLTPHGCRGRGGAPSALPR